MPNPSNETESLRYALLILGSLAATACQGPSSPTAANDAAESKAERVMSGCGEASRLLEQMKTAESSFRYDERGNAAIRTELWNYLPDQMKDGLVKAIAYHALCEADVVRDQQVTVRSAESSEILAQQTVTEFDQ
jgi:hypothetical protein